jgi:hypothetical protein
MSLRIPFIAAVVGALLVGGATTGTTRASWVDQAPLQAAAVSSGSMSFTTTTPPGVTLAQADGETADTSFVVDDTSVGRNLAQRITATVTGAPAGVTATVGTACGSTGPSVSVDTTPTSANQNLCVRVTSSSSATSGQVTINLTGAQRPSGWATPVTTVTVPVATSSALVLSCGGSASPSPAYRLTWNDLDASLYSVYRSSSADGPWELVHITGSQNRQYVEDEWSNNQVSHFRVIAHLSWWSDETSNVLRVRRNGASNNFTCGAP